MHNLSILTQYPVSVRKFSLEMVIVTHFIFTFFTELERFLIYATGKRTVSRVQINFLNDSEAISAHTCSNLIVFPNRSGFESFDDFCTSFEAVMSASLNFNIV